MSTLIAKRYAKAFFELSLEQKKLKDATRDIQSLAVLVDESDEFVRFIDNPIISDSQQQQILKKVFNKKIDAITFQFLLFLAHKKRLAHLKDICFYFDELCCEHNNVLCATIISSRELSDRTQKIIIKNLKEKFKNEIESTIEIDPLLIGGIKIQIEDQILDHSIQNQLKQFHEALINA